MPQEPQTSRALIGGKFLLIILIPLATLFAGKMTGPLLTNANLHLWTLQFLSLFIEAVPFLLIGSIVSGCIEVFVHADLLLRLIPKSRVMQAVAGTFLGFLFPVCECGVVPVSRRLMKKGMPASMGIAFLLAAPVMNPIVLFSTYKAFGLGTMFAGRYLVTAFVAVSIGLLLSLRNEALMREDDREEAHRHQGSVFQRLCAALSHAADDFLGIGFYLVIGAALASLMQTFLSQSLLIPVGSHPVLSVIALQFFAFFLSVCSTVDAFIALGFGSTFTAGAVLSFLTFGPMVDVKSTVMFLGVFKRKTVITLVLLPLIMTMAAGILINLLHIPLT